MKTDSEVHLMLRERKNGKTLEQAAARAGMSVPTARKYVRTAKLPSTLKQPRTYRTRANPFATDWQWVEQQLKRDPALQAKTLFGLLCEQAPERYSEGQLRTFQRHVANWRALHGPEREVIFEQVHQPGRLAQSDFTHMEDLGITLAGVPFPHLLFHLVLTYSNVEAVTICFSESFEALAEGLETCLWQIGGVPQQHRTDNLSAAVRAIGPSHQRDWTDPYAALMAHYGMTPTANTPGEAHENGDVEQAHFRIKDLVDQALRVRGSRDFADRAAYATWLQELIRRRNRTRTARWNDECQSPGYTTNVIAGNTTEIAGNPAESLELPPVIGYPLNSYHPLPVGRSYGWEEYSAYGHPQPAALPAGHTQYQRHPARHRLELAHHPALSHVG